MYATFKELFDTVNRCTRCDLAAQRQCVVFGEGSLRADVMFIGEGPGAREDATGRPFVGAAGQLFDQMLADIGLTRKQVFITNVVKCRPPGNRDPKPAEKDACIEYLRQQVAFIRPRILVALGRIAAGELLQRNVGIMREHGQVHKIKSFYIIPTFHPAALLHNPDHVQDAKADFEMIGKTLKDVKHAKADL